MARISLVAILLLTLVGCRNTHSPMNPFSSYGASQVPPPATGSARRTDPYYGKQAANANGAGQVVMTASATQRFTSDDNQTGSFDVTRQAGGASPYTTGADTLAWRSVSEAQIADQRSAASSAQPRPYIPPASRRLDSTAVMLPSQPTVVTHQGSTAPAPLGYTPELPPGTNGAAQPADNSQWQTRY